MWNLILSHNFKVELISKIRFSIQLNVGKLCKGGAISLTKDVWYLKINGEIDFRWWKLQSYCMGVLRIRTWKEVYCSELQKAWSQANGVKTGSFNSNFVASTAHNETLLSDSVKMSR